MLAAQLSPSRDRGAPPPFPPQPPPPPPHTHTSPSSCPINSCPRKTRTWACSRSRCSAAAAARARRSTASAGGRCCAGGALGCAGPAARTERRALPPVSPPSRRRKRSSSGGSLRPRSLCPSRLQQSEAASRAPTRAMGPTPEFGWGAGAGSRRRLATCARPPRVPCVRATCTGPGRGRQNGWPGQLGAASGMVAGRWTSMQCSLVCEALFDTSLPSPSPSRLPTWIRLAHTSSVHVMLPGS